MMTFSCIVVNMHIVILVVLITAVTEGGCCTIPIPPTAIEVDCQYKKLDSIPRLPPGIVKMYVFFIYLTLDDS